MEDSRDLSEAERGQPQASTATPPEQSDAGPRSWRRWIRAVFYVLYGLVVVTATPLVILDIVHGAERDDRLVLILAGPAFVAMVISLGISAWGMINHVSCFTRPVMQRYIIRMLWIIPIFEFTSWFSLRFPVSGIYLESIRQLYQAILIYNYVFYLTEFFEEVPNFDNRLTMKPQVKLPRPLCCRKVKPNKRLIRICKYYIHGYTILRIILTIISLITFHTGNHLWGWFLPKSAYLWFTILLTIAQIGTLFSLNLIRNMTREELQMLAKSSSQFVGVKLALFFDNFQDILLRLLATYGAVQSSYPGFVGDEQEFATMLQNFLLCFVMILVALLFNYAFDYRRYDVEGQTRLGFAQVFKQIWGVSSKTSKIIGWFRQRGNRFNTDDNQQSQTDVESPPTQENGAEPKEETKTPRQRKTGHQFISIPDIILNHMEDSDHAAQIHSPRNQDQNQDGREPCQNEDSSRASKQFQGIENPMFQEASKPEELKPKSEDGLRDDASEDTDDFLDDEFLTDDDDDDSDIDNNLPRDGRLDAARGGQRQRVKKVSYAGMTFDDLDPSRLEIPSHDSPQTSKKRVKKVSYAGMTFDDMDWEQIRSEQSQGTDSETAHTVRSIVEQSEEQNSTRKEVKEKGKPDGGDFGSSEA